MHIRSRRATAAAVCGLGAAALMMGPSAQAASLVSISQGHLDAIDVGFENNELEISIHDETVTPDVERDPADVVMVVKRAAKWKVPNDPAFKFLGKPGATVWLLPEIEDSNLLWPGIASEEIAAGALMDDTIRIEATAFSGPDGASLFTNGPSGEPQIIADSEDTLPDRLDMPVGQHIHANWAFEKAGAYHITVKAKAKLASNGQSIESAPAVLTFKVEK
ncbi:MAG: choice-of-anchor M domain-containing protein [Actinomycetota bacterium]